MPSSRRKSGGGGGGGIRKKSKRKDPNRQRLQKAALKSAEKERKQQLRYEAFQSRHLLPTSTTSAPAPAPVPASSSSAAPNNDASTALETASPMRPRDAYNNLMRMLATSEKPNPPKRPRTALSASDELEKKQKSKLSSTSEPPPPPQVSEDVADATAAARALAHFGLDSDTVRSKPKPERRAPVNLDDVGQVQATYEFPERAELPKDIRGLSLQPTLESMWRRSYGGALDPLSGAMVCAMRDFHDCVLTRRLPPATDARVRKLAVAHALAHVLRCRAQVKRHDNASGGDGGDGDGARDQGFSRARVLFLVPMRNAAHDVVRTIAELCAPVTGGDAMKSVAHRARFEKEFGPGDDDEEIDVSELDDPENAAEVAESGYDRGARAKPVDFRYTFRGNCDDDFKLGIQLYRKQMKLYTDFYDSDIIVASPLGLQRSQAAKAAGYKPGQKKDNEEEEWTTELAAEKNRKREIIHEDDGFLSSVEVCVIDAVHVFEMQNWSWLVETLRRVNGMPSNTRDTDFSRVREWALDGLMPRFRQTIALSAYRSPALMALLRTFENHAGCTLIGELPNAIPTRKRITGKLNQSFERVPKDVMETGEEDEQEDPRFDHFERTQLNPLLSAGTNTPTLVVVPSYFDFVRIRNALYRAQRDNPSISFATMCEYSRAKDVARARARLAQKQVGIVVCTERFHFYWRHWIRGIYKVLWYAPPANSHFYPEFLNMALENNNPSSTMMFDNTDALALARIVGNARCRKLLLGEQMSYEFGK